MDPNQHQSHIVHTSTKPHNTLPNPILDIRGGIIRNTRDAETQTEASEMVSLPPGISAADFYAFCEQSFPQLQAFAAQRAKGTGSLLQQQQQPLTKPATEPATLQQQTVAVTRPITKYVNIRSVLEKLDDQREKDRTALQQQQQQQQHLKHQSRKQDVVVIDDDAPAGTKQKRRKQQQQHQPLPPFNPSQIQLANLPTMPPMERERLLQYETYRQAMLQNEIDTLNIQYQRLYALQTDANPLQQQQLYAMQLQLSSLQRQLAEKTQLVNTLFQLQRDKTSIQRMHTPPPPAQTALDSITTRQQQQQQQQQQNQLYTFYLQVSAEGSGAAAAATENPFTVQATTQPPMDLTSPQNPQVRQRFYLLSNGKSEYALVPASGYSAGGTTTS